MNVLISKEDLDKLWHRVQVTFSEHLRMYLYWHQRLQHPSHVSISRLAERGALPSAIKYVKKAPPYAARLFAKAQRRAWHNKGKRKGTIRKAHHTSPGKGTSADHIISHQPGLILQVTGKLTHDTYWGAVTMVDHAFNLSYSHMIKGTIIKETVEAKAA
eukprot:2602961-Ditylum_brightwellii.AAC.1